MTNQLSVFNFQQTASIHIQLINDCPFFLLNDICSVLGFKNPRQALSSHVDKEDVQKLDTPTSGGIQRKSYVNESGLYALIFGSSKDEAKLFKRWVTSDVLPQIRKTGSYSIVVDKSDLITAKQLNDLKHIVHSVSSAYFYKDAFTQAAWKMIRDSAGTDSVKNITRSQLHLLAPVFERMLKVSERYSALRRETEKSIVKYLFRNNSDISFVFGEIEQQHQKVLLNLNELNKNRLTKFHQLTLNKIS